jgi:DNA-binding response OmpR family regulator
VPEERVSILIVEDDLDVADMLNAYFFGQGYEVRIANCGEEGVKSCLENPPQLVILDIRLPDFDGYEVARRLRKNRHAQNIPIIFLTEKRARSDRLQGLELGADDYITKPFDVQELRLRVRNALSRTKQSTLNNPVTNLPQGVLVKERLDVCLEQNDWSMLLVSLRNLEKFREIYGFVASDDVLRAISLMLNNAVRDVAHPYDFIGHFSPVDFIIITSSGEVEVLFERLKSRLEQSLDYFYPLKDRGKNIDNNQHLKVAFHFLNASQGPFTDLTDLKARLQK